MIDSKYTYTKKIGRLCRFGRTRSILSLNRHNLNIVAKQSEENIFRRLCLQS